MKKHLQSKCHQLKCKIGQNIRFLKILFILIYYSFNNPLYMLITHFARGVDLWGLSSSVIESNLCLNAFLAFPLLSQRRTFSYVCSISSRCLDLICSASLPAFKTPSLAITFLVSAYLFARSWAFFLCSRRVFSVFTSAIIMPRLVFTNQLS